MPVDALLDIVLRACGRISKRITDIGDIPYDLIRPVLLKIGSPEQLVRMIYKALGFSLIQTQHQIETNSPQIIGRDPEIWLALIKRDIPNWESKPHEPRDPKNWWKVYKKLKKESENDMAQGEDKLKAALDSINSEKEQNLAQIVTRKELPRSSTSMRQRIVHGYVSGRTGSVGASKLSLMEKVKKEARDARAVRMAGPNRDPVKKISSLVTRPPQQFVEDIRRAEIQKSQMQRQAASPERPIRAPRPPMHAPRPKAPDDMTYREIQDREARLRALTSGKATPRTGAVPAIGLDSHSSPIEPRAYFPSVAVSSEPFGSPKSRDTEPALSASFLESPQPSLRRVLGESLERTRSPGKIASPQPRSLKRKESPSLFMSAPKKPIRRPEAT